MRGRGGRGAKESKGGGAGRAGRQVEGVGWGVRGLAVGRSSKERSTPTPAGPAAGPGPVAVALPRIGCVRRSAAGFPASSGGRKREAGVLVSPSPPRCAPGGFVGARRPPGGRRGRSVGLETGLGRPPVPESGHATIRHRGQATTSHGGGQETVPWGREGGICLAQKASQRNWMEKRHIATQIQGGYLDPDGPVPGGRPGTGSPFHD